MQQLSMQQCRHLQDTPQELVRWLQTQKIGTCTAQMQMGHAGAAWRTDLMRYSCCTLSTGHRSLVISSRLFLCFWWITKNCTACRVGGTGAAVKQLHRCSRVHVCKAGPATAVQQDPCWEPTCQIGQQESQKEAPLPCCTVWSAQRTPASCSAPSSCSCAHTLSSTPNQPAPLPGQP